MKSTLFSFAILACGVSMTSAADWPGFRGPFGNGVAEEKTFPLKWGPKENIAWKVQLPGPGASSPVIWKDQVFITCFTGKKAAELVRHVICFDRASGKKLWQRDFPAPLPENDYVKQVVQHGFTTATPVTDGQRLYVFFGRGGVHALDLQGKSLWHVDVGDGFNVFGSGASPALMGDKVLVNACFESRFLFAIDKASGKTLWKGDIQGMSWSMPVVVDAPKGKKEIVLNVGAGLYGYDPDNGKELWSIDILAGYNGSTPLTRDGIIYLMNHAQGDKEFIAARSGGRGDVTKSHVLWTTKAGASYTSPLLRGDRLFFINGQAHALDVKNGKITAKKSLDGIMNMYGSPILAGDKIIVFTRGSGAYVLSADDKLEVLAHNQLGDDSAFNASPALVGGQIFMRSNQYLYCIGMGMGGKGN